MAEEHVLVRRYVVLAIFETMCGRDARIVEGHDLGGEKRGVIAIADGDRGEKEGG